jgi:hypothetical protein
LDLEHVISRAEGGAYLEASTPAHATFEGLEEDSKPRYPRPTSAGGGSSVTQ